MTISSLQSRKNAPPATRAFGKVIIAVLLRLSGSISRDPGFDDDMTRHAPVACTTGGREYKPNAATAGA